MLPILFTLPTPWGPQPIYAYGVLLGLALIAGYQIVVRVGTRCDGLPEDLLGNAYLAAALSGIVGARLLYVAEHWTDFAEGTTPWFDITSGGVTAYGGFFGGFLGAAAYLAIKRAPLSAFADAAAPALAAGAVLTRIGCYLYGCDFGTQLPEGAPAFLAALGTFPRWDFAELDVQGSPAFLHHVAVYGLSRDATSSLPVHPTQLYEALAGLALLALTVVVLRRRRFRGQVILAFAIGYGTLRFLFEYLRGDPDRADPFSIGFSTAQLISLALVPICAVAYSALKARARRTQSPAQ